MTSLFSKRVTGAVAGPGIAGFSVVAGCVVLAGCSGAPASPARPGAGPAAGVGVVADCAGPAPLRPSREPASIILACADSGIGLQDLDWTAWSAVTATGTGLLWENLCTPSCADGTYGHYQVAVTLSAVKGSARGAWFSDLAITWLGGRPANHTPDSYQLAPPSS